MDLFGFLGAAMWLLGLLALLITVRAVIKGATYIGAASKQPVGYRRPTGCSLVCWALFRTTPFAILVLFTWAGTSVIHDLGWMLGDLGFRDQYGEWTTYRDHISTVGGGMLGLLFSFWLIVHCQSVWEQTLRTEDRSPNNWLEKNL